MAILIWVKSPKIFQTQPLASHQDRGPAADGCEQILHTLASLSVKPSSNWKNWIMGGEGFLWWDLQPGNSSANSCNFLYNFPKKSKFAWAWMSWLDETIIFSHRFVQIIWGIYQEWVADGFRLFLFWGAWTKPSTGRVQKASCPSCFADSISILWLNILISGGSWGGAQITRRDALRPPWLPSFALATCPSEQQRSPHPSSWKRDEKTRQL